MDTNDKPDIKYNLKPLRPTGNETKEELLARFNKWLAWWDETLRQMTQTEVDTQEKYSRWEHKLEADVAEERKARNAESFKCSCHYSINSIGELHNRLIVN